tara:strand:- start:843 stop:1073 length:231 start_codon:yes stop_codon:yes gene_type:complete
MSSFIRIVRNYENICRLGHNIINHKDLVRRCPPEKLADEFRKQEERIDEFYREAEEAHQNWIKNKTTINEYWTGLS